MTHVDAHVRARKHTPSSPFFLTPDGEPFTPDGDAAGDAEHPAACTCPGCDPDSHSADVGLAYRATALSRAA